MKCEDCGGPLSGTPNEYTALFHGLRLCQSCRDAMDVEADAYAAEMMGECQFMKLVRQALEPLPSGAGCGEEL